MSVQPTHDPTAAARGRGVVPPTGAELYAHALSTAGGQALQALSGPGGGTAVGAALYSAPPYNLAVPALPLSRLSITLTASRVSGGLSGDRRRTYESNRHALFLTPAGASAQWHKESPSRHLNLYFDAEAMAHPGADTGVCSALATPLLNASIPGLKGLVDSLLAELQWGSAWSAEAADSLGRLLLIKVARYVDAGRSRAHALTPALLSRLNDYVHAHLAQRLLVSDLAQVVNMSPSRFAHLYTTRTGLSPHQFVMATRLQQAAGLLQHSLLPLAEVACACGFASQQHLTTMMRKRLGTTPGQYRQALQTRQILQTRRAGGAAAQLAAMPAEPNGVPAELPSKVS